jgi:potassium-transporting ATPase KdpC subunit
MIKELGPGLRFALILTVATGLLYPGLVTGICQLLFPRQSNGSMVTAGGRVVGSELIGQNFSKPEYFHPRPSAAGDKGYDGLASQGSNFGPTSQKLIDRVKASVADFRKENPDFTGEIPADIVTASASGLDPHISPAAAEAQVARVAKARGISPDPIRQLVRAHTAGPGLGFLGEPGVNILTLNLALDQQFLRK